MSLTQGNFRDLVPEDLRKLSPQDMDVIVSKVAEMILAEFKALDCTVCEKHFAYQHRGDQRIFLCSSECLALAKKKLQSFSTEGGTPSKQTAFFNTPPSSPHANRGTPPVTGYPALENRKTVGAAKPEQNDSMGTKPLAVNNVPAVGSQQKAPLSINNSNGIKSVGEDRIVSVPKITDSRFPEKVTKRVEDNSAPAAKNSEAPAPAPLRQSFQPKPSPGQSRAEPTSNSTAGVRKSPFDPKPAESKENIAPPRVSPPPAATQPKVTTVKPPAIGDSANKTRTEEEKDAETADTPAMRGRLTRPKPKKIWTMKDVKKSAGLKPGERCYVNFVWGPAKFTVVSVSEWQKLEDMRKEINAYCATAEPLGNPPSPNDILFACYLDAFYRCVVLDVNKEKQQAKVMFLDDGDRSTVKFSDCRAPSDEIMIKYPIFGAVFECSTSKPVPEKLSFESGDLNNEVYFESESETEHGWRGKLFVCKEKEKPFCWNDMLEKAMGTETGAKKPSESSPTVANTEIPQTEDPAIIVRGKLSPPPSKYSLRSFPLSVSLKNGAQVFINYCWTPRTLAVGASDDFSSVTELAEVIKKYVATAKPLEQMPALNDVVLCPYETEYYRAVVEELLADGTIRVRFVDYGDEATVSQKDLREINDEIATHPLYGMVVMIDGIPEDVLDKVPQSVPKLTPVLQDQTPCKLELKEEVQYGVWKGEVQIPSGEFWGPIVMDAVKNKA